MLLDKGSSSSSSMAQPPKKKRAQDTPLPPDAGQRPVQLQRRRVWRACESCRRKKIKCDGTEPVCAQCAGANTNCTWLQTKDRAALSRHYVQELEARLMHMEDVFKQVAPIVELLEKSPDDSHVPIQGIVDALQKNEDSQHVPSSPLHKRASSEHSNTPSPQTPSTRSSANEDDVSESFGQLALDEHGHLRWIGGSSTMSLIRSFRALTMSPLQRISPLEDDSHPQGPNPDNIYFPASIFSGRRIHALPGAEDVEYPERDLADKLIDAYFSRLHFLLPVVDKPSFLSAYKLFMEHRHEKLFVRAQAAFIALLFAVFACASRIVDDPRLDDSDEGGRGMIFYERALVLHYINYASIQIAHAWLLVGQAVRMSQDLGLHRYSHHVSIKPIEKQVRRKVFWSVYSLDRMLAMALGRPLGIEDSDCDAEFPLEYDDDELQEYFSGAQMLDSHPSLMVGFIALVELYKISGRVCRQIYGIDVFRENLEPEKIQELVEQATQLDKELQEWCNNLPALFKSAPTTEAQVTMSAVLCSHYYSVLTTLHRNFLPVTQSQYSGQASSLKAVYSARSCIRLAPSVKDVVPSSHHLAIFIQHLFSSAVIVLLYAMHVPDRDASRIAMLEAENCMSVVGAWEGVWPGARKCRELLSELAATAQEAIQKGSLSMPQPAASYGTVVSPTSPTVNSQLQRSFSGRIVKTKIARGKSRDSAERSRRRSLSVQRSRSVAPGPSGLARRAMSQKRPHDEMDRPDVSPVRAFHRSFAGFGLNRQESPPMGMKEKFPERQVSFIQASPVFEHSQLSNDPNVMNYSYSMPHGNLNWDDSTGPSNSDLFRNVSQDSEGSCGYNYDMLSQQNILDSTNLVPFGSAYESLFGGVLSQPQTQSQGDTPPLSSFATTGLPFRGLDFIRNYTPGLYEDGAELWSGFDGREFRYDPDLPFSFGGELTMDNSN